MSKQPKICFCAIFRNESKNVYRCLNSAKPLIDFVYICDTGSTDNTIDLVKKWGQENNIPTHVDFKEFRDFGYNRTHAYQRALKVFRGANYFLFLDADMILKLGTDWTNKSIFTQEIYYFKQANNVIIYDNVRLIKRDPRIKCIGVTHEYWDTGDRTNSRLHKDIIYIDDIGDGGHKQNKYERDIKLLENAIYHQSQIDAGLIGRYFFYLAKTYNIVKKYKLAIGIFKERIKYPCPAEEIYYSYYQIGDCYMSLEKIEKAMFYYMKAWGIRPSRGETLHKMANYHTFTSKNYQLAVLWAEMGKKLKIPNDSLFVEYKIHEYGFSYLLSIAYYYVNEKVKGKIENDSLLAMANKLPSHVLSSAKGNTKFYQ